MKKTLLALLVAAVAGGTTWAAGPAPVYSVNAVGVIKINVPGTNTLVGKVTMVTVPFVPVGNGTNLDVSTLDSMIGVNGFVAASSVDAADQILMWNGAGYSTAFLCNDGWVGEGFPETVNKWCYMAYDPVYTDQRPFLCSGTNIFNLWTGKGFWIRNVHANTTLTLVGEVPSIVTNDVEIGTSLTMVAYPYPVEAVLASIISTNDGARSGSSLDSADQIIRWNGSGYDTYFLCNNGWVGEGFPETDGKWCYMAFDPVYTDNRPFIATNVVVKPGDGFWYRSRGSAFTWPVSKPYSLDN